MLEALNWIAEWFNSEIYPFLEEFWEYVAEGLKSLVLTILTTLMDLIWSTINLFVSVSDYQAYLVASWLNLDPKILQLLYYLDVPQCFNLLFTAVAIRLVLRMIPGY